jgi:sialate O-acetylesterase
MLFRSDKSGIILCIWLCGVPNKGTMNSQTSLIHTVMRSLRILILAMLVSASASAALRLPSIFSDHMVLQRDIPLKVWGWDEPGTPVTVEFAGETYTTEADADGKWTVVMEPQAANSEPQTLVVAGTSERQLSDVLVGDVWICSGQSNMQWPLSNDWYGDVNALAADNPLLRLITVPRVGTQDLQDDFDGQWAVSSPAEALPFSAIGYYFGSHLQQVLDIPIGLIDNAWGGSAAEAWIRRDALEAESRFSGLMDRIEQQEAYNNSPEAQAEYEAALEQWETAKAKAEMEGGPVPRKPRSPESWLTGNQRPGNIYAGVLYPTIGYGIKGVIWYQGEANAGRAEQYRDLFPFMIKHWRTEWGQGDFPFYWVQLADFKKESADPQESDWAELREAQTRTLSLRNTGQAVIIDSGEGSDIHPRDKYTVASRLLRWALAKDYGYDIAYRSPQLLGYGADDGKITVVFDCFGSRLRTVDSKEVKGFAICGPDRVWHWAKAEISSQDTVVVWSDDVPNPVAVRYAWADNPVCNLISAEGLPVTPFRTDKFPMVTGGKE